MDDDQIRDEGKLPLPPDLISYVEGILQTAKKKLATEQIAPVAFIVNREKATLDIFAMAMANEREKAMSVKLCTLLCEDKKADAVIYISEMWTTPIKAENEADMRQKRQALRDQYGEDMAKYPNAQDSLVISVETVGHYWLGRAPIIKHAGKRKIGVMSFRHTTDARGRFVGFLTQNRIDPPKAA